MTEGEPRHDLLTAEELFHRGKALALDGRQLSTVEEGVKLISALGMVDDRPVSVEYGRNESGYEWVDVIGHDASFELGLENGEHTFTAHSATGIEPHLGTILEKFKRDPELEASIQAARNEKTGWKTASGFRLMEPDRFGDAPGPVFVMAGTEAEAIKKYITHCEKNGLFGALDNLARGVNYFTSEISSDLIIE